MQGMKLVLHQLQGKGHLLVIELRLDRYLFMGRQAREQVADLRSAIDRQARRHIPHIQLRVVVHVLDEVQFVLRQKRVALH